MQTIDDRHLAQRLSVNLPAGLQALAAAFCLASVGVAYHGVLSIGGAAVIATYAIVVPLRLPSLVFSRPFARFVLQAVARVAGVAGVIYILSIAINSGLPIIDTFAGVLFIGVLALGAVMTLRTVGRQALGMVPRLTTASGRVKSLLIMQLSLVWSSVLHAGPNESDFAGESRTSLNSFDPPMPLSSRLSR